jgi:2-methylaconitate cis-trans-isomerase PrpF
MGLLHHAVPGTCAIALAAAAAVPGTLVQRLVQGRVEGRSGGPLRFGHPSGRMAADADCEPRPGGGWAVTRVSLSRSARRLLVGQVLVPPDA